MLFSVLFLITACKDKALEPPKHLIDEDQMVDMIYDLSLLDAMKMQGFGSQHNYPTAAKFLKQKYQIDSITFAENSKYYASDIPNYKKMYERVKERLSEESAKVNGGTAPPAPAEEQGVVK